MAIVYWLHTEDQTDMFSEGYIGVTVKTVEHRYKQHKQAANSGSYLPVHKAIRKYGDLVKDILLEGSEEYCYLMEGKLRPNPSIGYNVAQGGSISPTTGRKHSEETKSKLARFKGKEHPSYGSKRSKEFCAALSERVSGENNPMYGKPVSEDTRKKLSESNRGKLRSEEAKANYSKATQGSKNPMFGKTGWLDPKSNKTVWSSAISLFSIFSSFEKCGNLKLSKVDGRFTAHNLESIHKKFKSGWNPSEDQEYLSWLEQYNKA